MQALEDRREVEEAASRERALARGLAAPRPLAIDDAPAWDDPAGDGSDRDAWLDDRAA